MVNLKDIKHIKHPHFDGIKQEYTIKQAGAELGQAQFKLNFISINLHHCHNQVNVHRNNQQAGAELGQAQVIIEVLVEVGVTLMLKL